MSDPLSTKKKQVGGPRAHIWNESKLGRAAQRQKLWMIVQLSMWDLKVRNSQFHMIWEPTWYQVYILSLTAKGLHNFGYNVIYTFIKENIFPIFWPFFPLEQVVNVLLKNEGKLLLLTHHWTLVWKMWYLSIATFFGRVTLMGVIILH